MRLFRGHRFLGGIVVLLAVSSAGCASGSLFVTSNPSGAEVFINDTSYGYTPLTMENLEKGAYALRIVKDDYEPWESEIEIKGAEAVKAFLRKAPPPPPPSPRATPPKEPLTKVTVVTDPPGAVVRLDGKEIGVTGEASPVSEEYKEPPTTLEITVEKPGYKRWRKVLVVGPKRDNRVRAHLEPVDDWYKYPTDAQVIAATVRKVVAGSTKIPALDPDATIVLTSITRLRNSDEPLQAVIEDAFMEALTQAGFRPGERDDQLMIRLAHSSSGERLKMRLETRHEGQRTPFRYDAAIETRVAGWEERRIPVTRVREKTIRPSGRWRRKHEVAKRKVLKTEKVEKIRVEEPITGSVKTADQLLAYRILECGLSKNRVSLTENLPEPMYLRRVVVRMHVRVIDAKTGTVQWAGMLTGTGEDRIPVRVSPLLENPPSVFAAEPLPDTPRQTKEISNASRGVIEFPVTVSSEPRVR